LADINAGDQQEIRDSARKMSTLKFKLAVTKLQKSLPKLRETYQI
jgi:hypothetical protein